MHHITNRELTGLLTFSQTIRRDVLYYSYLSNSAHIASCLSVADIIAVLYAHILPKQTAYAIGKDSHTFILSKGHAATALYAALYRVGLITKAKLRMLGKNGSQLGVHPEFDIPGVVHGTGSLGHGLSVGVGIALGYQLRHFRKHVYVLLSDAELNEGSVWEAIQFAAHHNVNNLTAIIDLNGFQALGKTRSILDLSPLDKKMKSFGWQVSSIDGHSHRDLYKTLNHRMNTHQSKPHMVIAKTVTGKGVRFMEHTLAWHYRNLDETLYQKALADINASKKNI